MGLRDIGETLPPGFRFYPSDEELVCHYLYKKIYNEQVSKGTLIEIDLHTCEPWQLPDVAKLNASEWYFFSFRDRKYATGYRTNRATISGYWKATGKDRTVINPNTKDVVGMRKTLVFYRNRAPNGLKSGWIMHEFRLETPNMPPKEDWVLCRVFHKSKGPENNNNTETQSPQHNVNPLTENMNYTSSYCFPSSTTQSNIDHRHNNQTVPNYGYNNQYDQMTSFNSSIDTSSAQHHDDHCDDDAKIIGVTNDRDMLDITGNNNNLASSNDFEFLWGTTTTTTNNLDDNEVENQGLHSNNFVDYLRFEINDNSVVFL